MKVEYCYFVCQDCSFIGGSSDFAIVSEGEGDYDVDFHCPNCGSINVKRRVGVTEVEKPSMEIEEMIRKSQQSASETGADAETKRPAKRMVDRYVSLDDKIAAIFYSTGLSRITTDSQFLHTAFHKLKSQHMEFFEDMHFKTGGRFPVSEDLEQTLSGLMLSGTISQLAPFYEFYILSDEQRKLIRKHIIPIFSKKELGEVMEIANALKGEMKVRVR